MKRPFQVANQNLTKRETAAFSLLFSLGILLVYFSISAPSKQLEKVSQEPKKEHKYLGQSVKKSLKIGGDWERRILYSQKAVRFCLEENEDF